jgi:hypothetical protein
VAEVEQTVLLFLSNHSVTADIVVNKSSAHVDLLHKVDVDGSPDETQQAANNSHNNFKGEVEGRSAAAVEATSVSLEVLEPIVDPEHDG